MRKLAVVGIGPGNYENMTIRADRALRECDEGVLEWVPKTEVESLPIWEGDRYFLRLLAADAPFFTMKLVYHGDTLIEARLNDMPYPISGKENAGC